MTAHRVSFFAALALLTCTLAGVTLAASHPSTRPPRPPYTAAHPLPKPEIFQPGVISTGDDESHLAFTPDGRTLYLIRNTPDFRHWTIVVSHHDSGRWSVPEVAPFSGRYNDADPAFSADGRTLFFISTRPIDGKGAERADTEIWRMQRKGEGWGEPEHLARLSSDRDEWFPTVAANGTLYFGSERPGGHGGCDIWRSRLVDGEYAEPENLGEPLNTAANEVEPFIAPDESYLIVAAGHPEGLGFYDLYVSYPCAGAWTKLEHLRGDINSTGWDFAPKVTPDGRYLFFASNRSAFEKPLDHRWGTRELAAALHRPGNGLRDIYQVEVSALGLRSPCGSGR
jgi:hypothetical protein